MTEPGGVSARDCDVDILLSAIDEFFKKYPPEPGRRLTLEEQQIYAANFCLLTTPREGFVSQETFLRVDLDARRAFDAFARTLSQLTPFRQPILDMLNGTGSSNRYGRRT